MTQTNKERSDENPEELPIQDDEEDTKTEAVNKVAADILPILLADLEEGKMNEVDFLGDLYARMVASVFMGYYPSRMADDAEDAAYRLYELAKERDNDAD